MFLPIAPTGRYAGWAEHQRDQYIGDGGRRRIYNPAVPIHCSDIGGADHNEWDVAFIAQDPSRADQFANGGTIGLFVPSPEHVKALHDAGTSRGKSIETQPSERPTGSFLACLLDPYGNKLTAHTLPSD